VVHTIGDPETRFREDPVRILRALKFAGRLDLGITPDVYDAIVFCREALAQAARPRVSEEILRLLRGGQARRTIYLAWETGVLDVLLPELSALLYDDERRRRPGRGAAGACSTTSTAHPRRRGPMDDTVLWTLLLLEPMKEASDGNRDRAAAVADFLEPLIERLAISRRYADGMRRIVAVLPRLAAGRGALRAHRAVRSRHRGGRGGSLRSRAKYSARARAASSRRSSPRRSVSAGGNLRAPRATMVRMAPSEPRVRTSASSSRRGLAVVLGLVVLAGAASRGFADGSILHELLPPDPSEDVSLAATTLDGELPAAVETPSGVMTAPDPRRAPEPEKAYSGGTNEGPESTYTPDRDTRRPDVEHYDDPFTPATVPFKRLRAYDAVTADYTLRVADKSLKADVCGRHPRSGRRALLRRSHGGSRCREAGADPVGRTGGAFAEGPHDARGQRELRAGRRGQLVRSQHDRPVACASWCSSPSRARPSAATSPT
jgi:hypothetical protein